MAGTAAGRPPRAAHNACSAAANCGQPGREADGICVLTKGRVICRTGTRSVSSDA